MPLSPSSVIFFKPSSVRYSLGMSIWLLIQALTMSKPLRSEALLLSLYLTHVGAVDTCVGGYGCVVAHISRSVCAEIYSLASGFWAVKMMDLRFSPRWKNYATKSQGLSSPAFRFLGPAGQLLVHPKPVAGSIKQKASWICSPKKIYGNEG